MNSPVNFAKSASMGSDLICYDKCHVFKGYIGTMGFKIVVNKKFKTLRADMIAKGHCIGLWGV